MVCNEIKNDHIKCHTKAKRAIRPDPREASVGETN